MWWIYEAMCVAADVAWQKLFITHLPPLPDIGASVTGLTAIVTGATGGIGAAIAMELARRGAHVILACRNVAKGEAYKEVVIAAAKAAGVINPRVDVMRIDLASLASVREFVDQFVATKRPLHVLINNAGIFDITGGRKETQDGFEQHMGSNHLGHFLLTMMLLPVLKRHACECLEGARIVSVSSYLHFAARLSAADLQSRKRPYFSGRAYANSKCAQVLFTRELRRRLKGTGVHAFAVHPGEVMTEIARNIPSVLYALNKLIMKMILLTPEQGARSAIYCASSREAVHEAESSFGYFNYTCRPQLPAAPARDDAMAGVLWGYSVRAVDLPEELACEQVH